MTNVLVLASQMEDFASFGMYNLFLKSLFVSLFLSTQRKQLIPVARAKCLHITFLQTMDTLHFHVLYISYQHFYGTYLITFRLHLMS